MPAISDRLLRNALRFTAAYNLMGFLTFLLPDRFGTLAALPVDAPLLHTGFVATNILMFGVIGYWQSRLAEPDRPVLAIFGASKILFFAVMALSWQAGEIALAGVMMAGVDLLLGLIFLSGAFAPRENQSTGARV